MFVGAVVSALVLGFLAGFFGFKKKERWCEQCGASTVSLKYHREHQAARAR
ncbi:MAG: hypothetical protein V7603_2485 [Micromonosporaceae bacterium]